jgi:hypothetical protein
MSLLPHIDASRHCRHYAAFIDAAFQLMPLIITPPRFLSLLFSPCH